MCVLQGQGVRYVLEYEIMSSVCRRVNHVRKTEKTPVALIILSAAPSLSRAACYAVIRLNQGS